VAKTEAYEIWWNRAEKKERDEAFAFADGYIAFLNSCKTEREVNDHVIGLLEKNGYRNLDMILGEQAGKKPLLAPGDNVYRCVWGKAVLAAVIGEQAPAGGVNAVASHIDAPRLDFKPNPFYEDSHFALAKTHYYGGIKKYQWVCIPLALHGVVYRKDGSKVEIRIGDNDGEPCFVITDLLPHLAQKQMEKKTSEAVTGEGLNLLMGSVPQEKKEPRQEDASADVDPSADNDPGQPVKANLLRILKESYGVEEKDFVSAEIEVVPAMPARDIGFDRGLIGGYAHDDRSCSYAALMAFLDVGRIPQKTAVLFLADKEEVGSQGNTGAQSAALGNFLADLCDATSPGYSDLTARRCFASSCLLSADVGAAVDPNYKDAWDLYNANFLGKGVMIEKYTGARGKHGGNDAHPDLIATLRRLFDEEGIAWQTGEIGKVDMGGGGTVAAYMANMGMLVIDCGVPVLSMHSPYEVISKGDLYNTFRAYRTFLRNFR